MTTPISFTVRPPNSAPYRPSPLGNGGSVSRSSRGAPSRRLFEQNGDGDEDDDDDYEHSGRSRSNSARPRDERIEGFGNGKAIGGEKPAGPLVIPALPNRDWRQSSSRRAPSYRPETRDPNELVETHDRTGDGPQRSGIRKIVKTEIENGTQQNGDETFEDVKVKLEHDADGVSGAEAVAKREETNEHVPVKSEPLTLEEQALQAILKGDVKTESEEERLRRELVIDMQGGALTEEEALKRDIDALPEESTADDYAAVPISAFGEAMARGMGWNPSQSNGTKIHEPKLRPALLGLGATALEKPLPPSRAGSSNGKKAPKPNKRDSMKYVLTGAIVKREREGSASTSVPAGRDDGDGGAASGSGASTPRSRADANSSRRGSPSAGSESDSKRRRDDGDDREDERKRREYETDEERARRKTRERDSDRDRYRDRYREYETEEERAKRKAKERERSERYGSDRDRDSGRDRDRDRDRDRYDRRDDGYRRDDRDRDRRDRDRRDERYSRDDRDRRRD
ncbi:hypothetical protein IAU59_002736 [Kwoniella sp. CBS 9459]